MDINRNQIFVVGFILVLLGIELRVMDSFVLTPRATKFLAEQAEHPVAMASNTVESVLGTEIRLPPKVVQPPEWLGWLFLSVGSVLLSKSITMPKPA